FIPTILLVNGIGLPYYTAAELWLVFFSGVLGIALADTWYLKALNVMGASRTGIVSSLFSPFVILLSAIFLDERMVPWQWLGFVLVMAGVLLVTWRAHRSEVDVEDVKRGVMFATGAVFMMAVGVVMVKEILETRSFLWTVELRLVGGAVGMFLFVLARHRWKSVRDNFKLQQPWGMIMLASFLGSYFALILWLAGYKLIDASVASVLNETNVVFIVLLAWLMLGEHINRRRLVGMGLTIAGVTIMVLV
ncbi:MAG: EamA family transporter, partial [Xanthomonadales bacterium]|nr:EamA family transporter [Gammaproteobacteria bacterium]NNK03533.1 EamA family transporter [Xanthomonadales bacterium]